MTNKQDLIIKNFEEMIQFFKTTNIQPKQMNEVLSVTIHSFFIGECSKETMILQLEEYWAKWKHIQERPIFIDLTFED
jgi:hypothetical protein